MPVGDVIALQRIEKSTRRADRASRRLRRALDRRDARRARRQQAASPSPVQAEAVHSRTADVSRWCAPWDAGDDADASRREGCWQVEEEVKVRIGKVRTDDGRRCLFAASIDGARVGVLVARRAPSIPDHPEAVSNAVGAPPLPGQLPLLDIQNATPRRLLFGPVTDDTRVYVRCIAASDADGEEAVPIFLLSGRDSAQPVVDAAAFGLDAADVTALQRGAARLLGAWA